MAAEPAPAAPLPRPGAPAVAARHDLLMAAEPAPAAPLPRPGAPAPAGTPGATQAAGTEAAATAGLAHVATASFLASRVVPFAGFAVALGGGVALARAGARHGARTGYGTSLAAVLQTVAVMGPSRINVPLTQALSAPWLGRLHARGARFAAHFLACAAIRLVHETILAAFGIWIILGGLDAFAGSYEALWSWVGFLPDGAAGALIATGVALLGWAAFASAIQVHVYRRALDRWPRDVGEGEEAGDRPAGSDSGATAAPPAGALAAGAVPVAGAPPSRAAGARAPRFDPRAVALAAAIAFAVLVVTTAWLVLAAVSAWLAAAWATARGERDFVAGGLVLAALLALAALVAGLLADLGTEETLRRAARAGLLVLVATWLRAAAGEAGLREVARRALGRLRRLPAAPQAVAVLERLGGGRGLAASGRRLITALRATRRRPRPLARAVVRWIAEEQARFRPASAVAVARPAPGVADTLLVALAAAAALSAVPALALT